MTDSVFDTLEALSKKAEEKRIQTQKEAEEDREVLQNFVLLCKLANLDGIRIIEKELCGYPPYAMKTTIRRGKDHIRIHYKNEYTNDYVYIDDLGNVTEPNFHPVPVVGLVGIILAIFTDLAIGTTILPVFIILGTLAFCIHTYTHPFRVASKMIDAYRVQSIMDRLSY